MRALVTGATGFVGSHLVETLRRRGDDVTALVRSPAKAGPLAALGVRIVAGDLDRCETLYRAAGDQDVVFHVAGLVSALDEAAFLRANRDGTGRLLEAAGRAGVDRFVFVSSMAAAGPSTRGRPLSGSETAHPVTTYGRSKLAAEAVVRAGSLKWTILRPPMVYGPGDREVLKVFRLARFGIAPVFGDGTQELSAIHAADLAEALIASASADAAVGRVYYPCHPETFTSAGFVRAVGAAIGRPVHVVPLPRWIGAPALSLTGAVARLTRQATILTPDKANEFFQPAWTGDPAPCMDETGWHARFDLKAGLADTLTWYRFAQWL